MTTTLAYLDPGSGSMLLQALLGGLAGLAVTLKLFGARIGTFLRFRRPTAGGQDPAETEGDS